MDAKKDFTKELLADCFRSLVKRTSFQRITIRMITDEAGLIRPTFYKHFQDKYEVLEWIFETEIAENVDLLLTNGMELDAILMLFRCLEKDTDFYRRAYRIEGPISLKTLLYRKIYDAFLATARRYPLKTKVRYPVLSYELIARYYTAGLLDLIESWLFGDEHCPADKIADAYKYLLSNSALDMITPGR